MFLPQSEKLNITAFSNLFRDTSACYKFFWFNAVIRKIISGADSATYDELVNEMIAEAWYMVSEYHLNLSSVTDNVEQAVNRLSEISGFKSSEKREKILKFLSETDDKVLHKIKLTLILNVPYRLQAPLLEGFRGNTWEVRPADLAERINSQRQRLIYYFDAFCGLETRIFFREEWVRYIIENQTIIEGWLQFNLVEYLQRKNPNVPGIIEKLHAPEARDLERVKEYWKLISAVHPVNEIYKGELLEAKGISIDHFVPWSYVANDEFWNLHPTTRSINSSKGNHLPDWDIYFENFSEMEYLAYSLRNENDSLKAAYRRCMDRHLNSEEVRSSLYAEDLERNAFCERLENIVRPVYQSAQNAGFSLWTA